MPYRIYQGKEVITTDALVLPRGQIFVDLDTLELRLGDGYTPGGIPVSVATTSTGGVLSAIDGGGAASIFLPTEGIDSGSAASVYLSSEVFDGGGA